MSDVKVIQNEELTADETKEKEEIAQMLTELMGGSQKEGEESLVLFAEPMAYSDEECLEMMQTDKFKEGLNYSLKLAGIYTGLIGFGVDAHTVNEIILLEHTKEVNIATQKIINEGVKLQSSALKKQQL